MMKKNQLTRALRIDKFTATALELVLQEYLSEENAIQNIPVLKMITESYDETVAEAKTFKRMLQRASCLQLMKLWIVNLRLAEDLFRWNEFQVLQLRSIRKRSVFRNWKNV